MKSRARLAFRLCAAALCLILVGCRAFLSTRVAPQTPLSPLEAVPSDSAEQDLVLSIDSVQVDLNAGRLTARGSASSTPSQPLRADLSLDGEPIAWWPDETQVSVEDGSWQLVVVHPEIQRWGKTRGTFRLRVYAVDQPLTGAEMPFDLTPPGS